MKADFERIAESYDQAYVMTNRYKKERINRIISEIIQLAELKTGQTLLDLGCGIGRFTIPFAYNFGFNVTGADKSPAMLRRAQKKDAKRLCKWVEYDTEGSPLCRNYFDSIFTCHLLHHLSQPQKALHNCYEMLKPRGVLIIRYGAWSQIKDDIIHRFFDETREIDEKRTPEIEDIEKWLKKAGFTDIISHKLYQQVNESPQSLIKALTLKITSVLTLISEESFQSGLTHLKEYVELHPDDQRLLYEKMTITIGRKKRERSQEHA